MSLLRILRPKGFAARMREGIRLVRRAILIRDEVVIFSASRSRTPEEPIADWTSSAVAIRVGTRADLHDLMTAFGGDFDPRWMEKASARLDSGDRIFIAEVGSRACHVSWLGTRESIDLSSDLPCRCVVPLSTASAVIYDCWTAEPFRGRGIYPHVLRHIAANVPSTTTYVYAATRNRASCRGILKAGFAPWRTARGTRFLGRLTWSGHRAAIRERVQTPHEPLPQLPRS